MQKTLLVLAALCASAASYGSTVEITKDCPGKAGVADSCYADAYADGFGTFHVTLTATAGVDVIGPGSRMATASISSIGYTLGPIRPGVLRLDEQLSGAIHGKITMQIQGVGFCQGFEPGCRLGGDGDVFPFQLGTTFNMSVLAAASAFTSFNLETSGGADVTLRFSVYELGFNGSLYGGAPVAIFDQNSQPAPVPNPEPSSFAMMAAALLLSARKAAAYRRAR